MPVHLKQIAPIEMSITFLYKEVWQSGLMYVYSALKVYGYYSYLCTGIHNSTCIVSGLVAHLNDNDFKCRFKKSEPTLILSEWN